LLFVCIDFLAASVSMMVTVTVGFPPHIYSIDSPHPGEKYSMFCKIRGYMAQSSTMMYRWFMCMACIDRCIVSSNNLNLREFSNPRMACSVIIKIIIIWSILCLHNLFFLDIKANLCTNSTIVFAVYHGLFTMIFGGFLPLLTMIVCIIFIRYNLASKRARRRRNTYRSNEDESVRLLTTRDQQVLLMLFIQVGFYIISTIPWIIFLVYSSHTRRIINKSINRIAIERFVRYLTEIIILMYPALSFYIYTLTSHTFRSELVDIICRLFTGRNRSQHDSRPVLIQTEVVENGQSDQVKKKNKCEPTQMDIYLDYSSK
jgi:hypothetical protein